MRINGVEQVSVPVIPKAAGNGFKVDPDSPTWPWRDLIGLIKPDVDKQNSPVLSAFRGGLVREYAYAVNDKIDCEFHIPHDYAPGTDIYIHVHWGHNGTAISGSNVMTLAYTYADRSDNPTTPFGIEKSQTITVSPNITSHPRWCHSVDEIQLTNSGGSGNMMNTADIEVDGMILVNLTQTTIPTITGGASSDPFIFTVDLHYQSTDIGTKSKIPDFYI